MGKNLEQLRDVFTTPKKGTEKKAAAEPRKQDNRPPVAKGCNPGETRYTTILREETLEEVRAVAYWDRRSIKAVVSLALDQYLKDWKKKNGPIKPIPNETL